MANPPPSTPGRPWPPWEWTTAPLAVWIVFVSYASLAPPNDLPSFAFDLSDKLGHAALYAVLALLLLRAWLRDRPVAPRAAFGAFLAAVAWGYYLECLQAVTGYRSYSLLDLAFDALGAGLGTLTWAAWRRCAGSPPAPASAALEGADS